MQKFIPYVVIALLALVAAAVLLMPGSGGEEAEAPKAAATAEKPSPKAVIHEDGSVSIGSGTPSARPAAEANPVDRPPNKAEKQLAERQSRPFNIHVNYVSAWWGIATMKVKDNSALAAECSEMSTYLRDMSRLNVGEMDPAEVLQKENALISKLRGVQGEYPELDKVLDYLQESAKVAGEGGDPASVVKPEVTVEKR